MEVSLKATDADPSCKKIKVDPQEQKHRNEML